MARVVHVIGNGDCADFYNNAPRKGLKLTCNFSPFEVPDQYATCIVDFKMMHAINKQEVSMPPGEWIVGMRPKLYCEKFPAFHMRIAGRIKEFYTKKPSYCPNYTDFNCGHMAVYYACAKLKADTVHMWGFDSIMDFNLRSYTDLVMNSDRGNMNNHRLAENWRPLWANIFKDFSDQGEFSNGVTRTNFVIHHNHDKIKFPVTDNVRVEVHTKDDKK